MLREPKRATLPSLNAEGTRDDLDRQLGQLIVGLLDALRLVLERQAMRRLEGGQLTPVETERLGNALMALEDKTSELKRVFRMEAGDVKLSIGELDGREVTLVDALDALLAKGVALDGRLTVTLADVELLRLGIQVVLAPPDRLNR